MKVYLVYYQYGEECTMDKLFADESKAIGYVDNKNSNKHGVHWFYQKVEVSV
jgi:hypothetical protein